MSTNIFLFSYLLLIFLFITNSEQQILSPKLRLNDGNEIPVVGYGTWKLVYDRYMGVLTTLVNEMFNSPNRAINTLIDAIETGYRHIDSAFFYNIEKSLGIALREVFKMGLVKREDLFITTKVWCNYHRRDRVVQNIKISLQDMGINYVDLALIHYPTGFVDGDDVWPQYFFNRSVIPRKWQKDAYLETWKGMEDAQRLGLAKSIGVSNFNIKQLQKIIDSAKIKPVVNQVECNPYYNQKKMLDFCKKNDIIMTAYSPLQQGFELLEDSIVRVIAQKYGKTTAQVVLKWNVQRGVVVIPKTKRRERMVENLNIFDFELTQEDMDQIDSMHQKPKMMVIGQMKTNWDYPFDE